MNFALVNSDLSYYSNGKLLLTGEYLVIYGAKALALPVRYGQTINISENKSNDKLLWIASENGEEWFRAVFSSKTLSIEEYSDIEIVTFLHKVLTEARLLNPDFINSNTGTVVETDLNFNRKWGLGSSSTLITNIALWAHIDPYCLFRKDSNGSGYDIACALSQSTIVYQLINNHPVIENIIFNPSFRDNIYFVYLGKKQNSALSIEYQNNKKQFFINKIEEISQLTDGFINASSIEQVFPIINEHEKLISSILNIPTIQDQLFIGFNGIIKSLGAWGGDFVMAITCMDKDTVEKYFISKGYFVIITFNDMVIKIFA